MLILSSCKVIFVSLLLNFYLQHSYRSICHNTKLLQDLPPNNNNERLWSTWCECKYYFICSFNQHKGGVSQAVLLPVTPEDVATTLLCFSSAVWQGCGANPPPCSDLAARSPAPVDVWEMLCQWGWCWSQYLWLSVTPTRALMANLIKAHKTVEMF